MKLAMIGCALALATIRSSAMAAPAQNVDGKARAAPVARTGSARPTKGRVLIVTSSHDKLGDTGLPTGVFLAEVTHPYAAMRAAGYEVDIASVAGGTPPIDAISDPRQAASVMGWDLISRGFLAGPDADKWRTTLKLSAVRIADYRAVLFAGGTGAMFDLASNPDASRLAGAAWDSGKVVAAFCHGVSALLEAKDRKGTSLIAGRELTAFSADEERVAAARIGRDASIYAPRGSLEAELVRRGALFRKGPPFTSFVVVAGAGRLITGQQPYSGLAVAQAVIASLDAIRPSDIPAASAGVRDDVARNRDLLQRYHVEVWEQGHLDRITAFIGPGFVSHAKPARLPAGVKPSINLMAELRVGFPDLTSHQDAILADGDLVSIRWTIRGTHTGVFLGIAPTGRKLVTSGMDILRVSDGKFVEHWGGVADQLDDISLQLDSKRATAREVVR